MQTRLNGGTNPDLKALAEEALQAQARIDALERQVRALGGSPDPDEPEPDTLDLIDFGALNEDPTTIEPRGWMLGNWFCREMISSLIGNGAVGKTAIRIAAALSLATGRDDILKLHVFERTPVIYLCFEDSLTELKRRIHAARILHQISNSEIAGYLHIQTISNADLKFITEGEYGKFKIGPLGQTLGKAIDDLGAGGAILDPFIKTHGVDENANTAMDLVAAEIAKLATEKNVFIDIPQHTRKGTVTPGDADTARGGSATKDAGRLGYTICPMDDALAKAYKIEPEDAPTLIRVDPAKVNPIRKNPNPDWFELVGVPLGNTNVNPRYPKGDTVQAVKRWLPPPTSGGLAKDLLKEIFNEIRQGPQPGEFFLEARQANADWIGTPIALTANLEKGEAAKYVRDWIKNNVLQRHNYNSPKRHRPVDALRLNEVQVANMLK